MMHEIALARGTATVWAVPYKISIPRVGFAF